MPLKNRITRAHCLAAKALRRGDDHSAAVWYYWASLLSMKEAGDAEAQTA